MATITAAVGGGAWTVGATWVGGSAPGTGDDAVLGVASGAVTVDAGAVCRSIDASAYLNTLTHTAAVTLTIGDATAGAGNVALNFTGSWTYTLGNAATSAISFFSTSATQQTIDFGGKTHGNIVFGTSGTPNYAVTSALTQSATTASVTCTFGHVHFDGVTDNAGLSHSLGSLVASVSNVRTITLGTATFTLNAATGIMWNMSGSANTTLSAASSIIISPTTAGASGAAVSFTPGGKSYGTLRLLGTAEKSVVSATGITNTFVNLERSGPATVAPGGTGFISLGLGAAGTIRVTGTLKLYGDSAINRLTAWPSSNGITSTLNVTGAVLDFQYVNFQDITFINGSNLDLSAVTGGSSDCGGNSITGGGTLTFTPAVTQHWTTTGAGNFSDVTKWTSRIPLGQDSVLLDAAFSGSPTITADMPWTGPISFAGGSGNVTLQCTPLNGVNMVGSFDGGRAGVTVSSVSSSLFLNCRGQNTFAFNGATISANTSISSSNGGNITFSDSGTLAGTATIRSGTLTVPTGVTLTYSSSLSDNSTTAAASTVLAIAGTLALSGTGTVFSKTNAVPALTSSGEGSVAITNAGASSKTFAGNGSSYPKLAITGGGAGAIIVTGANTFAGLRVVGGTKSITLPGSATTIFTAGGSLGNGTNVVTFTPSAGSATVNFGTAAAWDYVSLTNIPTGASPQSFAGSHSTDNGGNTNWLFQDAPSGSISQSRRGWGNRAYFYG